MILIRLEIHVNPYIRNVTIQYYFLYSYK